MLGLLDMGADCTQVPDVLARRLQLRPISEMPVTTADGSETRLLTYVAHVEFEGRRFPYVEVLSSSLGIALVGRDLLNQLVVELDGPGLRFSLPP